MAGDATLQQRVEQQVLRALQEKEAALDAALEQQQQQVAAVGSSSSSREGLTQAEADEELEALREKRKRQLQYEMQLRQREGYGTVLEIGDEKEFFEVAKKNKKVIAAFCRPSSRPCEVTLARLREFATRNLDIRCLHLNAEKSPFLCERLKIWCLPTCTVCDTTVSSSTNWQEQVFPASAGGKQLHLRVCCLHRGIGLTCELRMCLHINIHLSDRPPSEQQQQQTPLHAAATSPSPQESLSAGTGDEQQYLRMVLIQDGKTSHSVVGLDELGGNEFTVEDLERAVAPWLKVQKTSQQ